MDGSYEGGGKSGLENNLRRLGELFPLIVLSILDSSVWTLWRRIAPL